MQAVELGAFHRLADHAQRGARAVKVSWRRGQQPAFELLYELPFLFGFLDLGQALGMGVLDELGRQ